MTSSDTNIPPIDRPPCWRTALPLLALLALVAIVFAPTLGHGFLSWDDPDLVTENPGLLAPSWNTVAQFWAAPYQGLYTPIAYTAWGFVAKIAPRAADGSLDPHAFHLFNMLLHLAACALVYAILRRIGTNACAAFAGAALFGLHPLQVEPVAWISGMNNLLAGVFSLLAIWSYLGRSRGMYALATFAFALALLSKPTAVVVPVIVAMIDLAIRQSRPTDVVKRLTPWLLMAIAGAIVAKCAQPASSIVATPIPQRLLVAADALAFYLGKLFVSIRLTVDYGRSPQWLMQSDQRWWTWIFPAMLLVACIALWRRRPTATASIAIFAIALLPVLGLTPFDFQKYSTVADRYAYLAMLGPALLVASFMRGRATKAIATILLVALGIASAAQVHRWSDEQTLFTRNLEINPQSLAANQVMAFAAARRGDIDRAISYYNTGLRLHPDYYEGHYNLANLLLRQGRYADAIDHYHTALKLRPRSVSAWNNLAVAFAKFGDLNNAEAAFREALRIDPASAMALGGLEKLANMRHASTTPSTNPGG